jgi:hypothetical protein
VCLQLERDDEEDTLVLCDGGCKRSFHRSCLDMTVEEMDSISNYICQECSEGEHAVRDSPSGLGHACIKSVLRVTVLSGCADLLRLQCFSCGDMGKDHVAAGVHRCKVANCGKFYHVSCVSQCQLAAISKAQAEVGAEALPSLLPVSRSGLVTPSVFPSSPRRPRTRPTGWSSPVLATSATSVVSGDVESRAWQAVAKMAHTRVLAWRGVQSGPRTRASSTCASGARAPSTRTASRPGRATTTTCCSAPTTRTWSSRASADTTTTTARAHPPRPTWCV